MEDLEQDALFQIDGPDEDGCVWICSKIKGSDWCHNLGPRTKVVEVLSQWPASVDADDVLEPGT